ncbi:phosphoenolpyruvate--protein phosphotransferase [Sedimenticola thiotaurini]|uniref:Phosphoenolpyruvate-protein phosphotransferase n=1 Tax=Sedimenticola thiotaurini TaxID=1543721 RepID=A0A0F7JVV4_9GAMM|nr:phosphoenolpyruvate--protein phosphotransferase [Sedimenticola thiotaurini]AKH20616.1 phosphoenolpyruvate-protein phosphotransferase [Sedimenticola thiotaurini]
MTFAGNGIGITSGIAIGEAHILRPGLLEIGPRQIDPADIPAEVQRFQLAVNGARGRLQQTRKKIPDNTRSDIIAFIDTHLLMMNDAALVEVPIQLIRRHAYAAEWALQLQRESLVQVFDTMDDPYLRTRKDDVEHVVNQIQIALQELDEEESDDLQGKVILAQDLTPADTIVMRHQGIAAFITEFGGPMSHTAILARSLDIPAIVGVHGITRLLRQGETLVVDGEQGVVLADADPDTLAHYQRRINATRNRTIQLRNLIGRAATTREGVRVQLMANIELPEDIETTRQLQADAVGLYRTEFLYMNRQGMPDEEEHYQTYRQVVEGLDGIPITIRTLDLGADKQVDGCTTLSCNPALGLRAIRLCLKEPRMFQPQLRAILRAAVHGPVRIMIPMLSTLQEVRKLKAILAETEAALSAEGIPFAKNIPIGGMIEVPAAALAADAFTRELDFLSIGTNDLIQYTLAIDRVDDEVNYLYDPLHPSILRLIQMVIDAGQRAGIPISMCGEMAGDPRYIPLLIGMGLREFSMQPGSLLIAKERLLELEADKLAKQTRKLMKRLGESDYEPLLEQICTRH